jgi:hypothetical protein
MNKAQALLQDVVAPEMVMADILRQSLAAAVTELSGTELSRGYHCRRGEQPLPDAGGPEPVFSPGGAAPGGPATADPETCQRGLRICA